MYFRLLFSVRTSRRERQSDLNQERKKALIWWKLLETGKQHVQRISILVTEAIFQKNMYITACRKKLEK